MITDKRTHTIFLDMNYVSFPGLEEYNTFHISGVYPSHKDKVYNIQNILARVRLYLTI